MSQTRRLAAILAADVAGYSRLMGADEERTLDRLNALRRELLDPKITEHRGRIPGLLTRGPDHRRRPAGVGAIIMD
jgi:class 3 adenylate cyclase